LPPVSSWRVDPPKGASQYGRMDDVIRKKPAKEAILDAAVTLFARLGFEGASFSEITDLCGAKRPLILYHYGTKEDLWRLAVETVSRRFDEEMKARLVIDDDASDEAKMRASMAAFIDTLVAVPEFGRILLRGWTGSPRISRRP
jgi:AcrR family transcriptional regulator